MNNQELIEQSKNVVVALPTQAGKKELQTAFTLLCALQKLGKNARLERANLIEKAAPPSRPPASEGKTFIVSLRGLSPWISKIYYEKNEKDIKLYFTLQQGEVSPENLSLQIQSHPDLMIIVREHGSEDNPSPALSQVRHLSSHQALLVILDLLSRHEDSTIKLLGHTLKNLEYARPLDLYFVFIPNSTLEKTNTTAKTFIPLIGDLKEHFGEQSSYLFLTESSSPEQLKGVLWNANREYQKKILYPYHGEEKGNWTLFEASAEKLQELRTSTLDA